MTWIFTRLAFVFLFLILPESTNGSATITGFHCTPGPELCLNVYCNTTMSRENSHQLNCGCFIPRPVYHATLEIRLQRKRAAKYVTLVNIKEDLHNIVQQSVSSPIMAKLFSTSKSYLTGFEYPFQGNMTVRKMPVLLNYASVFMQSSTYRLIMLFRSKDQLVLKTELDFIIGNNKNRKKNTV